MNKKEKQHRFEKWVDDMQERAVFRGLEIGCASAEELEEYSAPFDGAAARNIPTDVASYIPPKGAR